MTFFTLGIERAVVVLRWTFVRAGHCQTGRRNCDTKHSSQHSVDDELLPRNYRMAKIGKNKIGARQQQLLERIEHKRHFNLSLVH